MGLLRTWRALKRNGVVGLNARNGAYILEHNDRRLYPLVDDKLTTKRLAEEAGIAVPPLYGVIETEHDVRELERIVGEHRRFVVKPANGSGGDGIVVVAGRTFRGTGHFRLAGGQLMALEDMRHHVSNTLNGQYSLGGHPDRAMIEHCVQADPVFEHISHEGVPDVRILVYRGVPLMAMVRLPTRLSGGKANLHQGAVGVGVDIATGVTCGGVLANEPVDVHPDSGSAVAGVSVPHWQRMLEIAAACADITALGYLGVDLVLDRELGPVMLELNARPGLNIQIANGRGLRHRLAAVEEWTPGGVNAVERAAWAQARFADQGA